MSDRDYTELYASLQKETTILTAQIRALYRELDKKFHLRGAQIPITFGFETDALGSYTRTGHHEKVFPWKIRRFDLVSLYNQ